MTVVRTFAWAAIVLLAWMTNFSAHADVVFQDQNGKPVPGVVVFASDATYGTSSSAADPRRTLEVDQKNKRFAPYVSTTGPESEVLFPNSDDVRHHVYSFSSGNRVERKLYRANEAEPVRLEKTGVVALGCNIHDNMQAYVLVTDRKTIGVSDDNGVVSVPADLTSETFEVWHPMLNAKGTPMSVTAIADRGIALAALPFVWSDPQRTRITSDLESLLRQFSNGTP